MARPPFQRHSLVLASRLASAGEASVWARTLAAQYGLDEARVAALDLCIVELINNIVDHGYRGEPGEIRIELALGHGAAVLTLTDDGPPFDPLAAETPPAPSSLETATIGGYGIPLVRASADDCAYERRDGRNVFTAFFGDRAGRPRLADRRQAGRASYPLALADGVPLEADRRSGMDRRSLGFISRCNIFRDVPWADLEAIVSRCRLVEYPAGEVILKPGPQSNAVLVLVRGLLRVHLEGPDSDQSFDVPVGDCVGEISVADGKSISAWVVTAEPSQLLVIEKEVFLERLLAIPRVSRNLISLLAERMREGHQWVIARTRAAAELKALQQELDVARGIQASMLPHSPLLPDCEDIRCHGLMRAASRVGGDFYDAIALAPGQYCFVVGDVCGKGMAAALFMSRALTILRGEVAASGHEPARRLASIARKCNDKLASSNDAQLFVSMLLAIVDTAKGSVHYCSVGHCAPLLIAPDGASRYLREPRNPIAGIQPALTYAVGKEDFPPGSRLLLYTDGVTEAEGVEGGQFGEERVQQVFAQGALDVDESARRLVEAIDAFAGEMPQSDDITLLIAGPA